MEAPNSVSGVNQPSNFLRILEICGEFDRTSTPRLGNMKILLPPFFVKLLEKIRFTHPVLRSLRSRPTHLENYRHTVSIDISHATFLRPLLQRIVISNICISVESSLTFPVVTV